MQVGEIPWRRQWKCSGRSGAGDGSPPRPPPHGQGEGDAPVLLPPRFWAGGAKSVAKRCYLPYFSTAPLPRCKISSHPRIGRGGGAHPLTARAAAPAVGAGVVVAGGTAGGRRREPRQRQPRTTAAAAAATENAPFVRVAATAQVAPPPLAPLPSSVRGRARQRTPPSGSERRRQWQGPLPRPRVGGAGGAPPPPLPARGKARRRTSPRDRAGAGAAAHPARCLRGGGRSGAPLFVSALGRGRRRTPPGPSAAAAAAAAAAADLSTRPCASGVVSAPAPPCLRGGGRSGAPCRVSARRRRRTPLCAHAAAAAAAADLPTPVCGGAFSAPPPARAIAGTRVWRCRRRTRPPLLARGRARRRTPPCDRAAAAAVADLSSRTRVGVSVGAPPPPDRAGADAVRHPHALAHSAAT
ncbi:hypothetical protein BU14_0323s0004 [Porphyra umbilicalis]|uniref:Uncharacterized protein n=1 Tax=Porphyra umbilicalis TaxID=2786 RepID=A0A1X6NZ23_PORUM|nr:hypothetical protein BU14_0323s0004 [Porphyra umbilicalis]|eukprot:OSX73859.1 hypothetical protein BU14_0323s0004 [Porphyra umbilicalis]